MQAAQTLTVCAPFSIIVWVFPYPDIRAKIPYLDFRISINNHSNHQFIAFCFFANMMQHCWYHAWTTVRTSVVIASRIFISVSITVSLQLSNFSKRELMFMFAMSVHVRYMLSPIRLSSVTFVHPTQAVQIFSNISTALGALAIHWHPHNFTDIVPG